MFYCAAPIHHRGLPALQRRHPNGDSLVSLGMAIVYAYSLLCCAWCRVFSRPAPRDPYFAFVGVVATLSLAGTLVRRHDDRAADGRNRKGTQSAQSTESTESARSQAKSPEPTQKKARKNCSSALWKSCDPRVLPDHHVGDDGGRRWTCALWLAFGVQPKLAIAILLGSTVLSVAGLVLQALRRPTGNQSIIVTQLGSGTSAESSNAYLAHILQLVRGPRGQLRWSPPVWSTSTVSPSCTSPASSMRASWSPTSVCTRRRSGRAP